MIDGVTAFFAYFVAYFRIDVTWLKKRHILHTWTPWRACARPYDIDDYQERNCETCQKLRRRKVNWV